MKTETRCYARALDAAARGDQNRAIHLFRDLVRMAPQIGLYHAHLADQLHAQDLYAPAIKSYRAALRLIGPKGGGRRMASGCRMPTPAALRGALASALAAAGQAEEAELEYRKAIDLQPSPERWVDLGHHVENGGRARAARGCYIEALRLDRGHPEALSGLAGLVRWYAPCRAEAWFKLALSRDPKYGEALTGLGCSYLVQGRLDEAESVLNRSLACKENGARPYVYLAQVHEARDEPGLALERYSEALRVDPADPHPLFALGDLHRHAGKVAEAQEAYEAALALAPDSPDALLRLGLLHVELKDDDARARAYLLHGLRVAPRHPWRAWLEEDVLPQLGGGAMGEARTG